MSYGYCAYEVEALPLAAGGLAGVTFTGTLEIDPDESLGGADWYIAGAWADGVIYSSKQNAEIYNAICKAVNKDSSLYSDISDMARESA